MGLSWVAHVCLLSIIYLGCAVVQRAACHRSVGRTDMNERSSRSHSVFTLHLKGERAWDSDLVYFLTDFFNSVVLNV